MEIELIKEQIHCFSPIYTASLVREETADTVVPDTMPDVGTILDAVGAVYLRSKETADGRLTISAAMEGTVLYIGEEGGGVCRLNFSAPVTLTVEEERISRESRVCVTLRCSNAEGRILNPRKVQLRCEISVELSVWTEGDVDYAADARAEGLQTLLCTQTLSYVSAVEEKSFVIAEDFALPTSSATMTELLCYRTDAVIEDIRCVAGKVIFQGSVLLDVLYTAGDEPRPIAQSFSTPFSQIMDVEAEQAQVAFRLMPTAAYVEALPGGYSGDKVSIELHLVAQALCSRQQEIKCLADAYSTRCPCRTESRQIMLSGLGAAAVQKETARELLETSDEVKEILYCAVNPGRSSAEGNSVTLWANARVLYLNETGGIASICGRLKCECQLPEGGFSAGEVRCREPYAVPAVGGVELRIPLELSSTASETCTLTILTAVETEESAPCTRRPSVTLARCEDGNLWALAKKYGSTTELIHAANGASPEKGQFLLIPKGR